MTEEKKPAKPKAAPKAKAAAPKAEAPKKAAASGKTVRLVQIGSPIGRHASQRQTLVGLKLNKMRRESELIDTPEVRGMISKVKHLVKVVG